jgi:hypothetical protein
MNPAVANSSPVNLERIIRLPAKEISEFIDWSIIGRRENLRNLLPKF